MRQKSPAPKSPKHATPANEAPGGPLEDGRKIDGHPGATDSKVGDRQGPGAGFDQEPRQEKDKGGVAPS